MPRYQLSSDGHFGRDVWALRRILYDYELSSTQQAFCGHTYLFVLYRMKVFCNRTRNSASKIKEHHVRAKNCDETVTCSHVVPEVYEGVLLKRFLSSDWD